MENKVFSETGSISGLGFNHIYPFVQESMTPFQIFNDTENTIPIDGADKAYKKNFKLNSVIVETIQQVINPKDGFDWICVCKEEVRYGIAIQIDSTPITLHNNKQPFSVLVNYAKNIIPQWPRQTNTEIPVIRIWSNEEPYIIAVSMDSDVQFHQYNDNKQRYIGISTNSAETLYILIRKEKGDMKTQYLNLFPQYKTRINRYKIYFKKLKEKYGLEIDYKGITDNDIEQYASILNEEISKYPIDFFRKIKVSHLVLSKNLKKNELLGLVDPSHIIILNLSSELPTEEKKITIHHEIYHLIDEKMEWSSEQDPFILTFLSQMPSIEKPEEYRAHLYAHCMVDFKFVKYLCETNSQVKQRFSVVSSILEKHDISIPGEKNANHPEISNPETAQQHKMHRSLFRSIKPQQNKIQSILGLSGTGLSIVETVVQNKEQEIKVLEVDRDNILEIITNSGNFAMLTRNPIDYCIYHSMINHKEIEESLDGWLHISDILLKQTGQILKYEDITTINMTKLNDVFKLAGFQIKRADVSFIDPEESSPYNRSSMPLIRNYWDKIRNEDSVKFLYPDFTCED